MTLEEIAQMQANLQKTFEPYQGLIAGIQKIIEPMRGLLDTPALMNSRQQIAALNSVLESMYQPIGATKMLETFVNATSAN